jgi:hypothetical protein
LVRPYLFPFSYLQAQWWWLGCCCVGSVGRSLLLLWGKIWILKWEDRIIRTRTTGTKEIPSSCHRKHNQKTTRTIYVSAFGLYIFLPLTYISPLDIVNECKCRFRTQNSVLSISQFDKICPTHPLSHFSSHPLTNWLTTIQNPITKSS